MTDSLLENIIAAVKKCGQIILLARDPGDYSTVKEGKANYVTKYDVAVQQTLKEELLKLCPGADFVGEEGQEEKALSGKEAFIVDPIDGTTNFIKGRRMSCVSVAYVRDGQTEIGIVYNPYANEVFSAQRGCGSYLNGAALHVKDLPLTEELVTFGTAPYYPEYIDATFDLAKKLHRVCLDVRRTGSAAIDLCDVAAGRSGLFFEYKLQPWDYAAGGLIAREAGAVVSRLDGSDLSLKNAGSVLAGTPQACREFFQIP